MNSKFLKSNLPVAVLSTVALSSLFVACSKKDDLALKDGEPNLSFSEENEPRLNLSEKSSGVVYNANGIGTDGSYQPAALVNGVYQIANAGNLYWFAEFVNGGNDSANAILTADIVVNNGDMTKVENLEGIIQWVPIGNDIASPYKGHFDGNNKKISGLYCKVEGTYLENGFREMRHDVCCGLFGAIGDWSQQDAKITDVSVNNSYFEVEGRELNIGTIAAYNLGTIEGCFVDGVLFNIVGGDSGNAYSCIGGICGMNHNAINSCKVGRLECKTEKTNQREDGYDGTLGYNAICGGYHPEGVNGCYYLVGSGFKSEQEGIMKNVKDNGGEVESLTIEQWNEKYPKYKIDQN